MENVDCTLKVAVDCINDWANNKCLEYPPNGDQSCASFEACAALAIDEGRCSLAGQLTYYHYY